MEATHHNKIHGQSNQQTHIRITYESHKTIANDGHDIEPNSGLFYKELALSLSLSIHTRSNDIYIVFLSSFHFISILFYYHNTYYWKSVVFVPIFIIIAELLLCVYSSYASASSFSFVCVCGFGIIVHRHSICSTNEHRQPTKNERKNARRKEHRWAQVMCCDVMWCAALCIIFGDFCCLIYFSIFTEKYIDENNNKQQRQHHKPNGMERKMMRAVCISIFRVSHILWARASVYVLRCLSLLTISR